MSDFTSKLKSFLNNYSPKVSHFSSNFILFKVSQEYVYCYTPTIYFFTVSKNGKLIIVYKKKALAKKSMN